MSKKKVYNIKIAVEQLKAYCALQDKCQWDVIQKMQKWGLLKISQKHILELLIQEKYVDEERYSRSFCRGKFKIKKWGKIKIKNELKKKYISDKYITTGLSEINDFEYQKELDKQYHKKKDTIKEKNHFKKTNQIAAYLINRCYE
ncbi:MAG: RecX family transcriptional regulator, partial [Bacteroidota bacterium]|nr:RecX family transcriptional regulator [Bacteroidota bacterium]